MKKRILVMGATGLVGSRFVELHKNKGELLTPDANQMDIASLESVEKYFTHNNPEVVINFAAYTNVSEAENQRSDKTGRCSRINVQGVENLLRLLPPNCHFIQISTDMVFPGSKEHPGSYDETSKPETNADKVTWYGFTKAEGERVVQQSGKQATILRIIYPFRSHYSLKLDYVRKPLSLFDEGKLYPMFTDQQISVTYIDDACQALEKIIDLKKIGIFHAGSSDTTTPFELVSYLLEKTRGVKGVVKPSLLPNSIRYPKYGGLKIERTGKELGIKFKTWREMVDEFIKQLS